jgi:hypothetical protein
MKKIILLFVLPLAIVSFIASCQTEVELETPATETVQAKNENYTSTEFPSDTTQLWLSEGDAKSDTVFIIGEGGPHNQLDFEWGGKTVWSSLPRFFSYYRVHVFQSTMLNKDIYHWRKDFTLDMARLEMDNSTEILARAIHYWKKRGKTVIVAGTSFSAFLIPHYIATRGNNADTYLMSAGRLDAHPDQVKYHLLGYNSRFEEDGKTLNIPDTTRGPNPFRGEYYFKLSQVKQLIKGALGQYRFTEELKDVDLSNLIVGYASNDTQVGALTDEEIAFLESKQAQVFSSDQGHAGVDRKLIALVSEGMIKL